MTQIKTHDPNIVSIQRHPGEKGYWNIYRDGGEKFIEDKKVENPRKKYRELRKPTRSGNYQKIMKEIDEKPNEWRFRLLPPGKFEEFRYDDVTRGVRAIAACPKDQWSRGRCKVGMQYQALRLSKTVFKTKESAAKWLTAHATIKY